MINMSTRQNARQVKRFDSGCYLDWSYRTIDEIRKDLDRLELLGVTGVEIEVEESYGSTRVKFQPFVLREETDEELAGRLAEQQAREESKRAFELRQLEILKQKYEA